MENPLQQFFDLQMPVGRYTGQTMGEIFSKNRQYFDQVVFRDMHINAEYTRCYEKFVESLNETERTGLQLFIKRTEVGIYYTGKKEIKELFYKVLLFANERCGESPMPMDTDYAITLPGMSDDIEKKWPEHMEIFKRFWLRLAIPEFRSE